jgi:hypothetical protein
MCFFANFLFPNPFSSCPFNLEGAYLEIGMFNFYYSMLYRVSAKTGNVDPPMEERESTRRAPFRTKEKANELV